VILCNVGACQAITAAEAADPSDALRYIAGARTASRPLPPRSSVLARLGQIARTVGPVAESLEQERPERALLAPSAAWQFLTEVFPLLSESGVSVIVPEELTRAGQRRLRARMRLGSETTAPNTSSGMFGLDQLVQFKYELTLGDTALSRREFQEIVALKRPLVRWRGEWIVVYPASIAVLAPLADRPIAGTLPAAEALRVALIGQYGARGAAVEVISQGEVTAVLERLKEAGTAREDPPPASFQGELRPYQLRGLAWLKTLARTGFGALLADDMGLGKTIQVIALLLELKDSLRGPALLICPTSVLGNWERELARFGPSLSWYRHHGPDRERSAERLKRKAGAGGTVLLTTYPLLRQDAELLDEFDYGALILDEAQNVKNPDAAQAQAARGPRLAMRRRCCTARCRRTWTLSSAISSSCRGTGIWACSAAVRTGKSRASMWRPCTSCLRMRSIGILCCCSSCEAGRARSSSSSWT